MNQTMQMFLEKWNVKLLGSVLAAATLVPALAFGQFGERKLSKTDVKLNSSENLSVEVTALGNDHLSKLLAGDACTSDDVCLSYQLGIERVTGSQAYHAVFQIDVGGLCNGKPFQWVFNTDETVRFSSEVPAYTQLEDSVGCSMKLAQVTMLSITTATAPEFPWQSWKNGVLLVKNDPPSIDFTGRLKQIQLSEAQAAKAAAAKRQQELAQEAARQAAKEAQAAERRAACKAIYEQTVNTKIKDLTVGESQRVTSCQLLGLYPPR